MASQQSQPYFQNFLSNDGTYHWSQKNCPWWAPCLGNHFGLQITWILKKFNFCSRYQPNTLKVVKDIAFGLYIHEEMSFLKISRLFTFLNKSFIFGISSIWARYATKFCRFINSECCIMTKWINQANKKQTLIFCYCYRHEKAMKTPNSAKTENIMQKSCKIEIYCNTWHTRWFVIDIVLSLVSESKTINKQLSSNLSIIRLLLIHETFKNQTQTV